MNKTLFRGVEALECRMFLAGTPGVIDVTQGLPDLQIQVAGTLPTDYLSGSGKPIALKLTVLNTGTPGDGQVLIPLDKGQMVDIRLVARPEGAVDASNDVELTTIQHLTLGALKPGKTKLVSAKVTLPSDVLTGSWKIVALVDPPVEGHDVGQVREIDETNNEGSTAPIAVTRGQVDLVGTVRASFRFGRKLISDDGKTYTLPVVITNNGNVAVPANTTIAISPSLYNVDQDFTFKLDSFADQPFAIGGLQAGKSKTVNLVYNLDSQAFPQGIDPLRPDLVGHTFNNLQVRFDLDTKKELTESDDDNNSGSSASANVNKGEAVLLPYAPGVTNVPARLISGSGDTYDVSLRFRNIGNITYDTSRLDPQIAKLVRTLDVSDAGLASSPSDPHNAKYFVDYPVSTVAEFPLTSDEIGILMPGQEGTFVSPFTPRLGDDRLVGKYFSQVQSRFVDSAGKDVTVFSRLSDQKVPVERGYNDIQVSFVGTPRFPTPFITGGRVMDIQVRIRNSGNLPTQSPARLLVTLEPDTGTTGPALEGVLEADPLATPILPGQSVTATLHITFASPDDAAFFPAGQSYRLRIVAENEATIDDELLEPPTLLIKGESVNLLANNTIISPPLTVAIGRPDLAVAVSDRFEPATPITVGDGRPQSVPIVITNLGNLTTAKGAKATLEIYARPVGAADDSQDVLLTTAKDVNVGGIRAGKAASATIRLPWQSNLDLSTGEYRLVVKVDTTDVITEHDETNNTSQPSSNSVNLISGLSDLSLELKNFTVPATPFISSDGVVHTLDVVLRNLGNVAFTQPKTASQLPLKLVWVNRADGREVTADILNLDKLRLTSLAPGASKTLQVQFTTAASVKAGDYDLKLIIDPDLKVPEVGDTQLSNAANNTLTVEGLTVVQGGPDVAFLYSGSLQIPSELTSGLGDKIKLPFEIRNVGNLPTSSAGLVKVDFYAHRVSDGADLDNDVPLVASNSTFVLAKLAVGGSKSFSTTITLPAGVGPGDYVIRAVVTGMAGDLSEANNTDYTADV